MGIFNFCRNGEDFSKNECYTRNEGYPDFSAKDVNYVTSRFLPNAEHCTIHDWHLSVSSKEWFAKGYQTIYTITLRLVHSSVYYTFSLLLYLPLKICLEIRLLCVRQATAILGRVILHISVIPWRRKWIECPPPPLSKGVVKKWGVWTPPLSLPVTLPHTTVRCPKVQRFFVKLRQEKDSKVPAYLEIF